MKNSRKSTRTIRRAALGASVCALALAACGGGGGGNAATAPGASATQSVPASVSSSVVALVDWASQLPPSDVTPPLATTSFTPPVSDTIQPIPIL